MLMSGSALTNCLSRSLSSASLSVDGLFGASARDLLDAVEGHVDGTEHPQRLLGAEIQRLLDPLVGALEGGVVVHPRHIAKQQQGKRDARREHQP